MMLKEIIQNQKSRVLIILIVILLFIAIIFCVNQRRDKNDDSNLSILDTEEMSAITGVWKVTEYLGESVEYHGAEATTETELNENNLIIRLSNHELG